MDWLKKERKEKKHRWVENKLYLLCGFFYHSLVLSVSQTQSKISFNAAEQTLERNRVNGEVSFNRKAAITLLEVCFSGLSLTTLQTMI